jgi:hypothetical protein
MKRTHFEKRLQSKSDQWLSSLVKEHGPLVIEYVFLSAKPRSPAFVEAVLLQKYLNDHDGHLPFYNSWF